MAAELVKFPERDIGDVPRMLRSIANGIENGEYGDAYNLAWIVDCGNGKIAVGLCGTAEEPALTGHFLMSLGMRELEKGFGG